MKKNFAIIDAGKDEIFVLAASWTKKGNPVLEGFYRTRPLAVSPRREEWSYPNEEEIRAVLSGFSKKTGISVSEVYAGISSSSINVMRSSGSILVSKYGKEITAKDMARCVEIGSLARIPIEREILHKVVMGFSVDGEGLIRDPEGLEAVKLGVEVNMVTINVTSIRNFSNSIAQAGYIPAGFVLSPLASSMRMLTEDDKEDMTVFICMRGKRIEVLFFSAGNLENCKVFDEPLLWENKPGTGLDVPGENDIFFREIMSMTGWRDMRRIVISCSKVPSEEFVHATEKILALPVRIAVPSARPFEDLPEDGVSYSTALGILDYLSIEKRKTQRETNPFKKVIDRIMIFLDGYF